MKLAIISHAYLNPGYLPVLDSMALHPGVELAWIAPKRYMGNTAVPGATNHSRTFYVPVHFGFRQGAFIYHSKALCNVLDDFQPDIILHEQEVYALGAAQIAAVAAKYSIPLVMFVWENLHRSLLAPRRWVRDYTLRHSSALIAGSNLAAQVHRELGFHGPIKVLPQMGISVSANPVFGRRGGDTFKVCFAGRLVRSKGVDCLLRAVATLHKQKMKTMCTIAGSGPELGKLKALAIELGILDQVHFCGQLSPDGIRGVLRQTDVLVLPSRRTRVWEEQFGRVLAEAMSEATITLGSATGSIREVIGMDDLIFKEDDDEALASILERLANDSDEFATRQQALWLRAKNLYENDILTPQRIRFLGEVLEMSIPLTAHQTSTPA